MRPLKTSRLFNNGNLTRPLIELGPNFKSLNEMVAYPTVNQTDESSKIWNGDIIIATLKHIKMFFQKKVFQIILTHENGNQLKAFEGIVLIEEC